MQEEKTDVTRFLRFQIDTIEAGINYGEAGNTLSGTKMDNVGEDD